MVELDAGRATLRRPIFKKAEPRNRNGRPSDWNFDRSRLAGVQMQQMMMALIPRGETAESRCKPETGFNTIVVIGERGISRNRQLCVLLLHSGAQGLYLSRREISRAYSVK
jgi:hypothetical protein